jgi:hypothetical protein
MDNDLSRGRRRAAVCLSALLLAFATGMIFMAALSVDRVHETMFGMGALSLAIGAGIIWRARQP